MRTYGGYGSGLRCTLCDAPSHKHQIEYELDFPGPDQKRLPKWTLRLHLPCYHAWSFAREIAWGGDMREARLQVA